MPDPSAGGPIHLPLPAGWGLEAFGDDGKARPEWMHKPPHDRDAARKPLPPDLAVQLAGIEHAGRHASLEVGRIALKFAPALRSSLWGGMAVAIPDASHRLSIAAATPRDLTHRDARTKQLPNHVPRLPMNQASLLGKPSAFPRRLAAHFKWGFLHDRFWGV